MLKSGWKLGKGEGKKAEREQSVDHSTRLATAAGAITLSDASAAAVMPHSAIDSWHRMKLHEISWQQRAQCTMVTDVVSSSTPLLLLSFTPALHHLCFH